MFVNSGMKVWKREEQFMNNVKVQTKLIIVMLATIVALVLCAVISSESMKQLQSKALETLEADERASYDEQIKQQVDNVISLCQTIYDQYQAGVYTEEEAKKLAADEGQRRHHCGGRGGRTALPPAGYGADAPDRGDTAEGGPYGGPHRDTRAGL